MEVKLINLKKILEFRKDLEQLCCYDWVPVPMSYPQIAFLAVRLYVIVQLVARQGLPIDSVSILRYYNIRVSILCSILNGSSGKSVLIFQIIRRIRQTERVLKYYIKIFFNFITYLLTFFVTIYVARHRSADDDDRGTDTFGWLGESS